MNASHRANAAAGPLAAALVRARRQHRRHLHRRVPAGRGGPAGWPPRDDPLGDGRGVPRRYPQVDWQPERFVTESGRVFCGGGVYSAIDLSLYLVERYCGHEMRRRDRQGAAAARRRASGSRATGPRRPARRTMTRRSRRRRRGCSATSSRRCRPDRARGARRHEPAQLRAALHLGDRRDAARVPAPAAHRRRPPAARDAAQEHRRRQPRRRLRGRQLLPHAVQAPYGIAAPRLPITLRP